MCRHFSYLGPPVSLSELIFAAPHSLAVQCYAPKDMRCGGTVNVDGFGVGWFPTEPAAEAESRAGAVASAAVVRRYRRPVALWQDAMFGELARESVAVGVLAAVRSATAGMPVAEGACAPFTDGRWLFSLNGRIAGWPDAAAALVDGLPTRELLSMDALTDAALFWAVLRRRLAAGGDPAAVLGELVSEVLAAAPGSRLNTLLTDGRRAYATTVTHSLWSHRADAAVLLASEPFDTDPGWEPIPDGQLVIADRTELQIQPLP
jgi:glutamine amidotransferase